MKDGRTLIAIALIFLGTLLVAGNFLQFDLDAIFWPLALILLGTILIFRPEAIKAEGVRYAFAGDWHIDGKWNVKNNELRAFAGDLAIDLREVNLPDGETVFTYSGFHGDVKIFVPEGIGLSVKTSTFVTEARINGEKTDHILTGLNYATLGYQRASKKFRLELSAFAIEVDIIKV